jgi:uncharacterized protein (TIGR02598 family)
MKCSIRSARCAKRLGFTLAEVVIALGVIAVAVLAILAVFPAALQTGHSAQNETRAAQIAQTIFPSLAARAVSQFSNVRFPLSDGVTLFPQPPLPSIDLTLPPSSYTLYADNAGQLINSASNASYLITIYTSNSVPGFTDLASANLVTLRVAWPANAPAANQTYRDYVRIISKY